MGSWRQPFELSCQKCGTTLQRTGKKKLIETKYPDAAKYYYQEQ